MSDQATIWHCPQCGRKFQLPAGKAAPDLCADCTKQFTLKRPVRNKPPADPVDPADEEFYKRQERERLLESRAENVLLTTAPTLAGSRIVETLEIVTAECVQGSSSWEKLTSSLTDFFGGRSGSMQQMLRDLRVACLAELRKEAAAAGGNAVICVDLVYSEIGVGRGTSMLMLVATGTAVRVEADC